MPHVIAQRSERTSRHPRLMGLATVALASSALLGTTTAWASTTTSLKTANLSGFPGTLENQSSRTLYVLSVERGAKLKCKGACLSAWLPVLVKSSVKTITLGANVKGKIGFVKRSAATKQVTFNSYPLYTYVGDHGPGQTKGFDLSAFGGRWYPAKASSASASSTPEVKVTVSSGSGKPTTTSSTSTTTTTSTTSTTSTTFTTTTTLSGGAGGY